MTMLQTSGGLNGLEITPAMHQDIKLFLNSLKHELGYPCSHRRLKTYIVEDDITTLKQIHERYVLFNSPEIQPKPRKIALSTFLKVIFLLTLMSYCYLIDILTCVSIYITAITESLP
jgi:hypothetical protein